MNRVPSVVAILALLALGLGAWPAVAQELSKGQTLYVPCYSNIHHGIKPRPFNLTINLSVRNTDPKRSVMLTSVDFHDTSGKLVKRYLESPIRLEPLMTVEYIVNETDTSGGSGANFMVRWTSEVPVNPLFVEAVMIGTSSQQGISFTSQGRPVAAE